jgi:hypothetical protein
MGWQWFIQAVQELLAIVGGMRILDLEKRA